MGRLENTINPINITFSLPNRRGKRPMTIGRPFTFNAANMGMVERCVT
jgi:hypothetical protein